MQLCDRVDSGALTGFIYVFQERERIYEIYEEVSGARLTTNMGASGDFEKGFHPAALKKIRELT